VKQAVATALFLPQPVLFGTNAFVLGLMEFTTAGGLGHHRIPWELAPASAMGCVLGLVLLLAMRRRPSFTKVDNVFALLLALLTLWIAARNHFLLWVVVEHVECAVLGLHPDSEPRCLVNALVSR
jgi:hypothetical protein